MPYSVLVIGPAWVGDMVMAQSLFKTIQRQHPRAVIDVLAPDWSLPLLAYMPEVRTGISMPVGHGRIGLRERWRLGRALHGQYDQAIVLPNSWKSALIPWVARIPRRTGWLGEQRYGLLNDVRRLDKQALPKMVERFVALANDPASTPEVLPPKLVVTAAEVAAWQRRFSLVITEPVLALCPGAAYGPAKQWPTAAYAALAKRWVAKGWVIWLMGSDNDQAVCAEIQQQCGEVCIDWSGKLRLAETIACLSVATAVVSNDSGLMHVAAALDPPVVAVYGSTDPAFAPPLNQRHRILYLGLDCSPCAQRECPLGHLACLQQITVEQVETALIEVLPTIS